jgi:hypothetical protein
MGTKFCGRDTLYLLLSYLDEKDVLDVDWILQELSSTKIIRHTQFKDRAPSNYSLSSGRQHPHRARKGCYTVAKSFTDEGPAQNLTSFCKKIVSPLGLQSAMFV